MVAMIVLAGCAGQRGGTQASPAEDVPENVDVVLTLDLAILEDENTNEVVNTFLDESLPEDSDEPRTLEGLLERAREEADTNVSIDGLNEVAVFARTPDAPTVGPTQPEPEYVGAVVTAAWERAAVLDDIRSSPSTDGFREGDSYEGVTVYEVINDTEEETTYLAEYEDGRWAFSTNRSVVEDVIDVSNGDLDTFGGDLREAYDRTREDAYVRYAASLSETQRELIGRAAERAGEGAPVDLSQFSKVTAYSGAYYTVDDRIGISTYLTAEDADAARRLNQTIGSLITLGKGTVEPGTPAETQLNALSTDRTDRAVGVFYEIEVDTLTELIREADTEGGAPVSLSPTLTAAETADGAPLLVADGSPLAG